MYCRTRHEDCCSKARIPLHYRHLPIRAASYFLDKLRKKLSSFGVEGTLFVLYGCPFTMSDMKTPLALKKAA
jgi:hypothetical protein